jgi:hypothetical protein
VADKPTMVQTLFTSYPASDLIAIDWASCTTLGELAEKLEDGGDTLLLFVASELSDVEADATECIRRIDVAIRDLEAVRAALVDRRGG